jgi:hypothetical protein
VSPQFHVRHDNFFETVRPTAQNPSTNSIWQKLAGFKGPGAMQVFEGAKEGKVVVSKQQNIVPQPTMNETQTPSDAVNEFLLNENEMEQQSSEMNNQQTNGTINIPTMDNQQIEETPVQCTRTRIIRRPQRLIEVYSAYYDAMHEDDYKMQDDMMDPIAFLAHTSDPDTMYYHQAMKQPD